MRVIVLIRAWPTRRLTRNTSLPYLSKRGKNLLPIGFIIERQRHLNRHLIPTCERYNGPAPDLRLYNPFA